MNDNPQGTEPLTYRIAVISSVPPDPSRIAGALILSRWLDHPQIEWEHIDPAALPKGRVWRVLDRLTRTRFHRLAHPLRDLCDENGFRKWIEWRYIIRSCQDGVEKYRPDLILSVAHGPLYKAAYSVSKSTKVPLVMLAQDWWPAFKGVKPRNKQREEHDFISICGDTAATIAVSDGMLQELGSPSNASVLHDIPSNLSTELHQPASSPGLPLKVIYAGNLSTYGPMVEQAALSCQDSHSVRLEIYGREPINWSEGIQAQFTEAGIYRGFVSPADFPRVAQDYDFVLAIMSFAPELAQRMRTCFLSKITELAKLGKPIVVWGPADCSAAAWARKTNAALCITDESPTALCDTLNRLAQDPDEQRRLTAAIRASAHNEFSPTKIREQFMGILDRVARGV